MDFVLLSEIVIRLKRNHSNIFENLVIGINIVHVMTCHVFSSNKKSTYCITFFNLFTPYINLYLFITVNLPKARLTSSISNSLSYSSCMEAFTVRMVSADKKNFRCNTSK